MKGIKYPCPQCGTEVEWHADCPGYQGRGENAGKVMVCYPYCGNAIRFACPRCQWWYREPNRRGDVADMGAAPSWLTQVLAENEESEF